jgi:hypothetical protein
MSGFGPGDAESASRVGRPAQARVPNTLAGSLVRSPGVIASMIRRRRSSQHRSQAKSPIVVWAFDRLVSLRARTREQTPVSRVF